MTTFVTTHANLTEIWRWQGEGVQDALAGGVSGVVDADDNLIIAATAVSAAATRVDDDMMSLEVISTFGVFKLDGNTGEEIWR